MKNLVRSGLKLDKRNELEGGRMAGSEGESNLAQHRDRAIGRPVNRGVPTESGVPVRKGRKANSRG